MGLLGYLLRVRTDPPAGSTIPGEVEVHGTATGAIDVNVVSGGGSGGGGLTGQETADAMALEPDSLEADSLTDYARRVAEAAEDTDPVPVTLANPPADPPSASAINTALSGSKRNILLGLGGAKSVAAGSTSARVQLATSGIVGVSITATGADIRFALGNSSVTASGTSHYLPQGQSRDFAVSASQYIAAIRNGSTDGVLEITELSA